MKGQVRGQENIDHARRTRDGDGNRETTSSSVLSMMWGDPKRAVSLEGGDPLATLLFQVSSPVHIPWGDTRWQELLTGYDVWIHSEVLDGAESTSIITQACEMMARHAFVSSNRA